MSSPSAQGKPIAFDPPTNMTTNPNRWPVDATQWRIDKGLASETCQRVGIQYDPSTHRVYLPIWDKIINETPIGILQGYQLRDISNTGAKYLTAKKDSDTTPSTVLTSVVVARQPVGYLVEDLASALALTTARSHVSVTCNYGTRVTPTVLAKNVDIRYGVVWLDNDSDHVCKQAETIRKVWEMISGKPTYVESRYKDPKSVGHGLRKTILKEWSSR